MADGAIRGSFDSTYTVGFGVRGANPSCGLTGDPTSGGCGASANTAMWSAGDDGNLNYRRGDLFTAYGKGTNELLLKMPEYGLAAMGRISYLYDAAATSTTRTELSSDAKHEVARDVRLLDLWLSKTFNFEGQSARVRLGNQVINWGESLFLPGGINATSAVDNQRLMIPGTQLKEAVLPSPILSVAGDIAKGLQAEAYYQFHWNKNRYAPIGTYWSASDFFGPGRPQTVTFNGNNFNVTGLDAPALVRRDTGVRGRVSPDLVSQYNQALLAGDFVSDPTNPLYGAGVQADIRAKNSGQFGLSTHYKPEGTSIDIGAYYLRYHDKAPVLNIVRNPAVSAGVDYQWQYLEGRQLFGLSANMPVGNWAVGAELSYRPKDAIALSGCFTPGQPLDANVNFNPLPSGNCPMWANNKKFELHLTGMLQLMPAEHGAILNLLGADSAYVSIEGVFTRFPGVNTNGMTRQLEGVDVTQLPAAGYATWLNDPMSPTAVPKGVGSANSAGMIIDFNWTYDSSLIRGWQVIPGITYFRGLSGSTPTFSANYMQGVQSTNVYVLFNQNPATWQAGLNYTAYFGGGERNFYADRDFVGGFVSYNF